MRFFISQRLVDRPNQTYGLKTLEQQVGWVDFPGLQAHVARTRHGVVVVVPAVADADDRHEPIVHAVVFDFEILVSPLRHMANDVQNQGRIQCQNSRKQAGTGHDRSESYKQNDAENYAAYDIDRVAQLPISARLQKSVERVFEQVFALSFRVDVLGIVPFAVERVGGENSIVGSVGIERQIRIAMMRTMNRRPPDRRAVEGEVSSKNEEIFNRFRACKSAMRQQSVQSDRYSEHVPQIENEGQACKK